MRILNRELTKNESAVITAMLFVLTALYMFAYIRLVGAVRAQYAKCRRYESRLAAAAASAGAGSGDFYRAAEGNVSQAVAEIIREGKSRGIDFDSVKTAEPVVESGSHCRIVPIEMKIRGRDTQIAGFFGCLDTLKKSLIRLKSSELKPSEHDRTTLTARLVLRMYFLEKDDA